jgi:hypothetical protein
MSVILPQHRDLSIFHNFQKQQECTVEELFENIPFNPDEWDSELAFQKAKATNEMWSMHWLVENTLETSPVQIEQSVHSLYAPSFTGLMKLMVTKTAGLLIEYP